MSKKKVRQANKNKKISPKGFTLSQFFSKERVILAGILIVAFILRMIYISQLKANDPNFLHFEGTDMGTYHNLAQSLLDGIHSKQPYSFNPLYYYFLALIYALFNRLPYTAIIIQVMIGLVSYILTYLIAKRIFNARVGLIAAGLSAIYGTFFVYEAVLLTAVLDTFLLLLCVFFILKAMEKKSLKRFFTTGVVLGLSALCRATTLFVAPFIVLWMLIMMGLNKRFLLSALVITLGTILTIAPATIRNAIYSNGKFIPLTVLGKINFWVGNNEDAEGLYYIPPYAKEINPENKDNVWSADVKRFITQNPSKYARLLLTKFCLFWRNYEFPDNDVVYERFEKHSPLLRMTLTFGIITALGAIGILLSLWSVSRKIILLYLVILSYMGAIVSFYIQSRLRVPIVPYMLIFSAFTISFCYEKIRLNKHWSAMACLGMAGIFYMLVNFPVFFGWMSPIISPHGFSIEKRFGCLVRDYSGDWHGEGTVTLDIPQKVLQKRLFIAPDQNLSTIKEVGLGFHYSCNAQGYLLININGHNLPPIACAQLTYGKFVRDCSLSIKPQYLKNGWNTITFKVIDGAFLTIMVDNYYNFGRSFFSINNGTHFEPIKGEYMMHLSLQKTPVSS